MRDGAAFEATYAFCWRFRTLSVGSRLMLEVRNPLRVLSMTMRGTQRGAHERLEQGVRLLWPRLELGVELAAHEVGVRGQLDHLDQTSIGRRPRDHHAVPGQGVAEVVVHLIA